MPSADRVGSASVLLALRGQNVQELQRLVTGTDRNLAPDDQEPGPINANQIGA